jgi:hypothetical protein
MRKTALPGSLLILGSFVSCSVPFVAHVPLERVAVSAGLMGQERSTGVAVVIHDARPHPAVLGLLTSTMQPDRIHWMFATEKPDEVAGVFRTAAKGAVEKLGFKEGTDVTLEITIRNFRVDLHQSGSLANCIGYGEIDAVLEGNDRTVLRSRSFSVTFWEDAGNGTGFGEIARHGISRLYALAAWEVTAGILEEQFPPGALPAIGPALALAKQSEDAFTRRESIFWIGLTAAGDESAPGELLVLVRSSQEQEVREASAEALGMLGATGARGELDGILSSSTKLPQWDMEDTENVWYLLKSLHALGEKGLEGQIPKTKALNMPSRLTDLLVFLDTGKIPPLSASRQADYENGLAKLK